MKKIVLVTVLVLGIVVGTAMAQQNMHMKTTDQSMHQGQGMHQGQNMYKGHGIMGGGMGMDMMCNRMMGNMNAANQQKFLNDTKELRKQMQMNPQDINNLEQEMFNLSEKMKKQAEKYLH